MNGDDIQAIKAGLGDGDIFVINKADRDGVYSTEREVESLLSLSSREDGWQPPIIKTIATENKGIDDLAAAIERYREFHFITDLGTQRRRAIARWRILELLREVARANPAADSGADTLDACRGGCTSRRDRICCGRADWYVVSVRGIVVVVLVVLVLVCLRPLDFGGPRPKTRRPKTKDLNPPTTDN